MAKRALMQLPDLTWTRVQSLNKEIPVVFPVAALEEHGHDLPMFTDSLLLGEIMRWVAEPLRDRVIFSAQLYRPVPPHEHHFSQLASVTEDLFLSGKPPWPIERSLLTAGLLETSARPATHLTARVETPELAIPYGKEQN